MPSGVYGARQGRGAVDALCHVSTHVEQARLQRKVGTVMIVLDEEKFYDRLLLGTLETLASQIGLDAGDLAVLHCYRHLRRQL